MFCYMSKDGERRLRAVHEDWPAVAAAIEARMSDLRVSQHELALASGVSVATLRILRRGDGSRRAQDTTLAAVSRALGWPGEHLVRVLLAEDYPRQDEPANRWNDWRQAPVSLVKASADVPTQILVTLRRIERSIGDIATYLTRV